MRRDTLSDKVSYRVSRAVRPWKIPSGRVVRRVFPRVLWVWRKRDERTRHDKSARD